MLLVCTYYHENANKHPLGRCDFAGVKRRPRGVYSVAGAFYGKLFQAFWSPGAIQKNKNKTYAPLSHTATALANVYQVDLAQEIPYVVAGVGIADGSLAKYDVGI